jgi:hypothetical protein
MLYLKHLSLSIVLIFSTLLSIAQQPTALDSTIYVVAAVDEKPLYEGKADTFLFRFIGQQIRLPHSVRDVVGVTGTAYTSFVIDENGRLDPNSIKLLVFKTGTTAAEPKPKQITNEQQLSPPQLDCVMESKRIIKLLSNWTPARIGGKSVKCSMTLPITFKNQGLVKK